METFAGTLVFLLEIKSEESRWRNRAQDPVQHLVVVNDQMLMANGDPLFA
jgi:hypothetical protein